MDGHTQTRNLAKFRDYLHAKQELPRTFPTMIVFLPDDECFLTGFPVYLKFCEKTRRFFLSLTPSRRYCLNAVHEFLRVEEAAPLEKGEQEEIPLPEKKTVRKKTPVRRSSSSSSSSSSEISWEDAAARCLYCQDVLPDTSKTNFTHLIAKAQEIYDQRPEVHETPFWSWFWERAQSQLPPIDFSHYSFDDYAPMLGVKARRSDEDDRLLL